MTACQTEIAAPADLLTPDGLLAVRGYAKRPLLRYNPEVLRACGSRALARLRLKEWDYYGTTTPEFFFSITVANVGYLGLVFAYLIDFPTRAQIEKTVPTPLGRGCQLPRSSERGDVEFRGAGVVVRFVREAERRILSVSWKRFHRGETLEAELILRQPEEMDSIVMATPIGARGFYYNQKVNCMPTSGRLRLGTREETLTEDRALSTLDWGRGVWPYVTFWNWASASGFLADGRRFGLNLGKGFGDLSAATENCVFIDGRMTKLGRVDFAYDPSDYLAPWRFVSDDGRLRLTLRPFLDRTSRVNLLVARTEVHQMFGRYEGEVTTDAGETVRVRDLVGWAEEHRARW